MTPATDQMMTAARADAATGCVPPRSLLWHHLTFAPVRNVGRNSLPGGRPRDSDRAGVIYVGAMRVPRPSVPPSSPVCVRGPKVNRDPAIKPPSPPASACSAPDCLRARVMAAVFVLHGMP